MQIKYQKYKKQGQRWSKNMVNEIKTFDERKKDLVELGKKNGYLTYEQLAENLKGIERLLKIQLKKKAKENK